MWGISALLITCLILWSVLGPVIALAYGYRLGKQAKEIQND